MTNFNSSSIADHRAMGLRLLHQSVPYQMYKAAMQGTLAKSAYIEKKLGLGIAEWKVLLIIGSFSPVSTKGVADQSSLDKPTISRTTEKLVSRKLVSSAEDKKDRRKLALTLTKAGSAKYLQLLQTLSSWDATLLKCLTDKQIESLDAIIRLIQGRIARVSDELDTTTDVNRRRNKRLKIVVANPCGK